MKYTIAYMFVSNEIIICIFQTVILDILEIFVDCLS